jgi:hypothetical protein
MEEADKRRHGESQAALEEALPAIALGAYSKYHMGLYTGIGYAFLLSLLHYLPSSPSNLVQPRRWLLGSCLSQLHAWACRPAWTIEQAARTAPGLRGPPTPHAALASDGT